MLWNNQPDREAFGLVRKGVGQSTVLRAVETPYPKVNPIQSNPGSVQGNTSLGTVFPRTLPRENIGNTSSRGIH